MTGGGTLVLTGDSSFSGSTTIDAATTVLVYSGAAISPNSPMVVNGTLDLFNALVSVPSLTGSGMVECIYASSTVAVTGTSELDGTLSDGAYQLGLLVGAGASVTLSGVNPFSGGVDVEGGAVVVANSSALGSGPLTLDDGTLVMLGGFSIANSIQLSAGGGTIDANGYGVDLAGQITGPGGLIVCGGGSVTLTAAGAWQGDTVVENTTLQLAGGANLGDGEVTAGGTLGCDRSSVSFGNLTVEGLVDLAGAYLAVGCLSGSGTVQSSGGCGTLSIGAGGETSTFSGTLQDGGGHLALVVTAGSLTLAAGNTYSGGTDVENGGTLQVSDPSSLGQGGITLDGGTLAALADESEYRDSAESRRWHDQR